MKVIEGSERLSIVLPAREEARALESLLPALRELCPHAEIIVVDDGSEDDTGAVCERHAVTLVRHPYSKGNGAAIKTGTRAASRPLLLFMDADGQHDPADISRLLERFEQGFDMVVGARDSGSQANVGRLLGNRAFNRLSSWMVGQRIEDLTSGFRLVDAEKFKRFVYLLPNGFSYPTTITMAFFRVGFSVGYVPIRARRVIGESHVRPLSDGFKFVMIIFRVGSLYSPLKLFLPVSFLFAALGVGYYAFTYVTQGRFTNMGALLMSTAVLVFLIGLVSEQVSALYYRGRDEE